MQTSKKEPVQKSVRREREREGVELESKMGRKKSQTLTYIYTATNKIHWI